MLHIHVEIRIAHGGIATAPLEPERIGINRRLVCTFPEQVITVKGVKLPRMNSYPVVTNRT
jgi:hypothetical protein